MVETITKINQIKCDPTKTIHGWRVPKLHFICCMYIVYDTAIAGSNRNSACNDDTQWSGGNWSTFISGEKPHKLVFFVSFSHNCTKFFNLVKQICKMMLCITAIHQLHYL